MLDLITISEACKLLRVHPNTLRKHESPDGRWCEVYGARIRIYRLSNDPRSQRRYNRAEIVRLLARLQRGG